MTRPRMMMTPIKSTSLYFFRISKNFKKFSIINLVLSNIFLIFVVYSINLFMEIIIPIGISGSGKTRLYRMRYRNYTLVSPDLIRKELTGNISDQSKNKEVFQEVDRRIDELVKEGQSFFYDATNVNTDFRKAFVNKYKDTDVKIIYVILPADVATSILRIKTDLKESVERAQVPIQALIRQYGMYNHSLKTNFEGENVQEIIYIKEGELD